MLTLVVMVAFSGLGVLVGIFKGMILQRVLTASLLGLVIGVVLAISYRKAERGRRRVASLDARDMMIEEIAVECSDAVELVPVLDDADDPSFCIDAGGGYLLLLRGQWLLDPEMFGAPPGYDPGEENADTANFLPEPHAFPRTRFKITRAPLSGDVFAVELGGRYLPPAKEVDALKREYETVDSVLLKGSLDDLQNDLERHFKNAGNAHCQQ